MALQIVAQVLAIKSRTTRPHPTTGEMKEYGVLQLLSANASEGGPEWDFHTLFIEPEEVDPALTGKMVRVPVRAYTDRKTQQTRLSPVDGASIEPAPHEKLFVKIQPEFLPELPKEPVPRGSSASGAASSTMPA